MRFSRAWRIALLLACVAFASAQENSLNGTIDIRF